MEPKWNKSLRSQALAAHDRVFERLIDSVESACADDREGEPAEKLAAAVTAGVEFARRSPEEARLLTLDAMAVDPVLADRVLESNEILAGLLRRRIGDQFPRADSRPDLIEAALVGAITSAIGARLTAGEADSLRELEPELVELALMPYLGLEAARRMALDRSARTA